MLDVDAAFAELSDKSCAEIETETAYKWASRALAAFMLTKQTGDKKWLLRYEDYTHEALEHAAQVRDLGQTVREIELAITAWLADHR